VQQSLSGGFEPADLAYQPDDDQPTLLLPDMRAEMDRLAETGGVSHPDQVRVEQVTVGQTRSERVTVERVTVEHITTEYVTAEYVTVDPHHQDRAQTGHRPTEQPRAEHRPTEHGRAEQIAEHRDTPPPGYVAANHPPANHGHHEPTVTEPSSSWPIRQEPGRDGHEPGSPRQEPGSAWRRRGSAGPEQGPSWPAQAPAGDEQGQGRPEPGPAWHDPGSAWHEPGSTWHEPGSTWHEPESASQAPEQAPGADRPRSARVDAGQEPDRSWPIRQETGQESDRDGGFRRDDAGTDDPKPPRGHKGSRRSGTRSTNTGPVIPSPATSAPGSPAPAGAADHAPGAGAATGAEFTDSASALSGGPLTGNAPPDYVAPDNAPPVAGAGGRIPTDRARNRAVDRHWSPARNRSGAVRPPSRPFIRIPGRHAAMSRRQAWETRYVRALLWCDLLAGVAAGTVAFALRFGDEVTTYNRGYLVLSGLLPVLLMLVLAFSRAYERRFLFVGTDEYQRVIRAGVGLIAGAAVVSYALELDLARSYVLAALPTAIGTALVLRFALRKRLHLSRKRGENMRRVIVVGHELAVVGITRQLNRERYHGLEVVGACLPPHHDGDVGLPVYGTFDDVGDAVEAATADTVLVLSCPELDGVVLRRLAWRLERDEVDLIVASALIDVAGARTTIRPVDGLPMLHVEHPRLHGGARLVKDTIDRVGALVLTLVLAPVLLGVALSVRLTSRGPVLFRQVRVGRDGTEFRIFKFRSMYVDAEARLAELRHLNEHDGVLFKIRDDPRVTPVGRWLRRLSLDELPQLLNVLTGQMSLVGPRPPLPVEVAAYADDVRRRLAVKPGMTGLWQVSGRSDLSWEEAVRLDLRYVENWSLSLDLVILLRTMTAVVRSSGAY
jgi:exopolysaccharide biosynthesis polyprenyl glycosylphosphotransferase